VGLGIAVLTYSTLLNHKAPILVGTPTAPDPSAQRIPGPAALDGAGPIAVGDLAGGVPMPTGQVSLTFDDGPHPVWTPLILDELDRLDVTATFFVVGERVTEYRYLARAIVDRGHEIANHTQLHPQMGQLSERQIKAQLDLARLAIVNATRLESDLYRPPYSAAVLIKSAKQVQLGTKIRTRVIDGMISADVTDIKYKKVDKNGKES